MKKVFEWLLVIILFAGVLFYSSRLFVDKEVITKEYLFILIGLFLGGFNILRKAQSVNLGRLSFSIFSLVLYILILVLITNSRSLNILYLISFLCLFFYFKSAKHEYKRINIIIIALSLLQAFYGLLLYFQTAHTLSGFPIVGSYDNPAGFAACLAVAFPLAFSLFKYSKYCKIFAVFSILIIGCAIFLSESRAGVVSIGIVSLIFLHSQFKGRLKNIKKYLIPSIIAMCIVTFLLLLFLKKDSASGRILIWNVTWEMIKDAPILGHGNGIFLTKYMDYQADYFTQKPDSKYAMLADNVLHPFNEYLLLITEYGFIGFILLLIVIFYLLKSSKMTSPYMLCLISLGVFSLFSYPMKYPFVWIIAAYCLAKISNRKYVICAFKIPSSRWFKLFVLACMSIGVYYLSKDIYFEYKWNRVAKTSLLGKTKEVLPQYEKLHNNWNQNPLFLYNYGAELNYIKEYDKSNAILYQCLQFFTDYDVQMLLADNYFNLEKWDKAKTHYNKALSMCPNRFIPLEQLHIIALAQDNNSEARKIAQLILDKPVKISSPTINRIKLEMKQYLTNGMIFIQQD